MNLSNTEVMPYRMQTFHPCNAEDIQKLICEARENGLQIKWYGGSFPVKKERVDVVIALDNMRRFVCYDPEEQTFTFESGLTISEMLQCMEYKNFTVEIYGIIPDMTVADAVSVGLMGSNGTIAHCLRNCQIIHSDGSLIDWLWPDPKEVPDRFVNIPSEGRFVPTLETVVCGLGVFGIISTATMKCIPIHLAQETAFECPLKEMVNNWQQLMNGLYSYMYWYPLLDKVIIKRASSVRLQLAHLQPWWKKCMEIFYWSIHWLVVRASPYLAWYAPSFSKKLSQAQFHLVMKASSCRMQHTFRPQLLISVASYCNGIKWAFPAEKLYNVIEDIRIWTKHRFHLCCTPVLIAIQTHQAPAHHPYLSPYTEMKTCTLWTDWFNSMSISSSYCATMAEFESLLQKNGGRKCWSAGPVCASPLIGQMYPGFRQWCDIRALLDPTDMFRSGYVIGDLLIKG